MARMPTYFIPHGGGPCFFMEWEPPHTWDSLAQWLQQFPATLPQQPKALLVISGHWETRDGVAITAHKNPPLIYDYGGFPLHTYELTWPAPGAPELAARVQQLLQQKSIAAALDDARGFDHGVFIPLKVAFPDAAIPTIQLSLRRDLNPAFHLALGEALAPLRDEGVLILGSGMSYHNMRAYNWDNTPIASPLPEAFDRWLEQAVSADAAKRRTMLTHWADATGSRHAHPREEHLLPLMVVAGAAGADAGSIAFRDQILGAPITAVKFG